MQTGVLSTNAGSGNSLKVDQHLRQDLRSGACSETTEGALFCAAPKMITSPLKRMGLSYFWDTPHREATGVGYF